jgi:hypothetical protein
MNKSAVRSRYYAALAEGNNIADASRIANGKTLSRPVPAVDTDGMTDDELRDAIKRATGRAPHWKAGRDKMIEQLKALADG